MYNSNNNTRESLRGYFFSFVLQLSLYKIQRKCLKKKSKIAFLYINRGYRYCYISVYYTFMRVKTFSLTLTMVVKFWLNSTIFFICTVL